MTWLDSLTQLQETCLTTSLSPMAALLLLTLNTTGKICVKHGTHSNLGNTYSSRSSIALITHKQGESPSVRHKSSRLRTPRSFQLESSTLLARWNDRLPAEQTWNALKTHFARAHRRHKQIQGGTAAASGHATRAVAQPAGEDLAGAAIDAFFNSATATAVDRGIVTTLTGANSCLTKQLEDISQTLKEIRALIRKERNDRSSQKTFLPSNDDYCWRHGYKIARNNSSENCVYPKTRHKREAIKDTNL
jgi:hypothetical protein